MKSKCKFCSYTASRDTKIFTCDDCQSFVPLYVEFFEMIEEKLNPESGGVAEIDAQKDDMLNLLSQVSFIIYNDPRLNVFFNAISYLLDTAIQNRVDILESDFSRNVRTVRSLTGIYNFLEESDLIDVDFVEELKQRKIKLKQKLLKFAETYLIGSIEEQQKIKAAHILTGYVFSKLCFYIATENRTKLPYKINPKTLWCTLMLIFITIRNKIDQNEDLMSFTEEEYNSFLGKRGIQSTARSKIIYGMKNINGKITQGLISQIREIFDEAGNSQIELEIANYVRNVYEQTRARYMERDR